MVNMTDHYDMYPLMKAIVKKYGTIEIEVTPEDFMNVDEDLEITQTVNVTGPEVTKLKLEVVSG